MAELKELSTLSPEMVRRAYIETEIEKKSGIREDVLVMIGHYPVWTPESWNQVRLGILTIFNEGKDWAELLAKGGQELRVKQVAQNYLRNEQQVLSEHPDFYITIQKAISDLRDQRPIPPLILIPGNKYRHAPDSDFIDGTKRAIAAYVHHLQTGEVNNIPAFVGSKAPFLERATRKFQHFGAVLTAKRA